jgi:hypothetical protein
MTRHGLLLEESQDRPGFGPFYILNPARVADYEAATDQAAADQDDLDLGRYPSQPPEGEDGRLLRGERVVILGGDLPQVATALRRLALERHARWAARLDGPRARLLVALADDGPRVDEVERAVRAAKGTVTHARIDRFFDHEALTHWLDSLAPDSDRDVTASAMP